MGERGNTWIDASTANRGQLFRIHELGLCMTNQGEQIPEEPDDSITPDDITPELNSLFEPDEHDGSVEVVLQDTEDEPDEYADKIEALQIAVEDLRSRVPMPGLLKPVFTVSNGTGGTVSETLPINGTMGSYTGSPRQNLATISSSVCLEIADADGQNYRYVIITGGSSGIVSITGTLTQGGVYTCNPTTMKTNISFSGTSFGATTIVTIDTTSSGVYCNLIEAGTTTHDLASTTNPSTLASYVATGTEANGTVVYAGPHIFAGCTA